MTEKKWRRTNFYVKGSGQIRYGIAFALLTMITVLAAVIAMSYNIYIVSDPGCQSNSNCMSSFLTNLFSDPADVLMLIIPAILNGAFAFLLGLLISHKSYGPFVSIDRHVDALITGDYKHRLHLREKDHFQSLAEKLNSLAETLEKDQSNQST